jgi:histidyl-tRNA synthetase
VSQELQSVAGATTGQASEVLQLVAISGSNEDILTKLETLSTGSERAEVGVARLRETLACVNSVPGTDDIVRIDASIARGLDYYTGLVLETTLDDLPTIGSVASGGRYDNLAELYTNQQLPGIGASLGLDRLLDAMDELKLIEPIRTPALVFIPYFDAARLGDYFRLAGELRAARLTVEIYPDATKLGKQLQYADRRGHRVALIAGEREFAAGECQIKNLASGESTTAPLANHAAAIIAEIQRILAN